MPNLRQFSGVDFDSLGEFVGAGSYGFVFKRSKQVSTSDLESELEEAIKITFNIEELAQRDKEQERMLRECTLPRGKVHPNLVNLLYFQEKQFYQNDFEKLEEIIPQEHVRIEMLARIARKYKTVSGLWLQMELCGRTLREWLTFTLTTKSGSQEDLESKQLQISQGLVEGLKFLHENNIIHRDFKPENIMFQDEFNLPIKIGDFGLCRKIHSDESRTSTLTKDQGTPDYRAPEMDSSEYGLQADLFSLGLVIWEVLQLIPGRARKTLFYQLVHDENTDVVDEHSRINNAKSLIVRLTKRKVSDRMAKIESVVFRQQFFAEDEETLKLLLETCSDGDVIILRVGRYTGPFKLERCRVTIKGMGKQTLIRVPKIDALDSTLSAFLVTGNNCKIRDLSITCWESNTGLQLTGCGNKVKSVSFLGGWSLHLNNSCNNKMSHLTIDDCVTGISITGDNNKIENSRVTNATKGIEISGYGNKVAVVELTDVKCGIEIGGQLNKVIPVHIRTTGGKEAVNFNTGVLVTDGIGHEIGNLTCDVDPYGPGGSRSSGWDLDMAETCEKVKVSGLKCSKIRVKGQSHRLIYVKSAQAIHVEGSGHKLEHCQTKKFYTGKSHGVTFIDCKPPVNSNCSLV